MDRQAKLERRLKHAAKMERVTATRIRRLVTALQGWQAVRDKVEEKIGQERLRQIMSRLEQ